MKKIIEWFNGKKFYFVSAAAGLTLCAQLLGWLDPHIAEKIYGFLGVSGAFALRSAIKKAEK